jgi:hypothetical protein
VKGIKKALKINSSVHGWEVVEVFDKVGNVQFIFIFCKRSEQSECCEVKGIKKGIKMSLVCTWMGGC